MEPEWILYEGEYMSREYFEKLMEAEGHPEVLFDLPQKEDEQIH